MKKLKQLLIRFRTWRLHCWADALLQDAEHHRHAAKMHSAAASTYWMKANDIRALAKRLQAAGF